MAQGSATRFGKSVMILLLVLFMSGCLITDKIPKFNNSKAITEKLSGVYINLSETEYYQNQSKIKEDSYSGIIIRSDNTTAGLFNTSFKSEKSFLNYHETNKNEKYYLKQEIGSYEIKDDSTIIFYQLTPIGGGFTGEWRLIEYHGKIINSNAFKLDYSLYKKERIGYNKIFEKVK